MAISRRDILRLGVSYGTGSINFGNDSVVYDRELRKLPNSTVFAEFIEELEAAQKRLEEEMARAEAEEQERLAAETAAAEAGASEDEQPTSDAEGVEDGCAEAASGHGVDTQPEEEPVGKTESESEEGSDPTSDDEESDEESDEEPHVNPFADAISKANDFIDLCGRMALSGLYQQTRGIVASLVAEEFPPVEDIETMKQDYQKLMEYLQTH